MSISIHVDFSQVVDIAAAMRHIEAMDKAPLLDELGAEGESQTRRRLQEEKQSPDGTPWPAWSDAYAETRHGNQSLLQSGGDLMDSITYNVSGNQVEIGSNLVYAAHQNFGGIDLGTGLPAREYLGFSDENIIDLTHVVEDSLRRQLEAL